MRWYALSFLSAFLVVASVASAQVSCPGSTSTITPSPAATPGPPIQTSINSLTLMDAGTWSVVAPLNDGAVVDLTKVPKNLSIRANTNPPVVGFVVFNLNNGAYVYTAMTPPYDMCGKMPCALLVGNYTLAVTPFAPSGFAGATMRVRGR